MSVGLGHVEWLLLFMAEVLDGPYKLTDSEEVLRRRPPTVVTDCKSLYDHVVSVQSPSTLDDRRCALDVLIIRESVARCRATVRWAPSEWQLADCLTKDTGDPADLSRWCMREGTYRLHPEHDFLRAKQQERDRRLDRGRARALESSNRNLAASRAGTALARHAALPGVEPCNELSRINCQPPPSARAARETG